MQKENKKIQGPGLQKSNKRCASETPGLKARRE